MKNNSIFQSIRTVIAFIMVSCVVLFGVISLVGCGKDTPEPPDTSVEQPEEPTIPEEPTTPEEPPQKEIIKVYFESPMDDYEVQRDYADRVYDPYIKMWIEHKHIDLTSLDNEVLSIFYGVVTKVSEIKSTAFEVTVDYGEGLIVTYGSLESVCVEVGQNLETKDLIGVIGTNLNELGWDKHLCLTITLDGVPVNPTPYIDGTYYREIEKG